MKRKWIGVVLGLGLLGASAPRAGGQAKQPSTPAQRRAAQKQAYKAASFRTGGASSVDAAWTRAMLAGDVEAVVRCYASDAILWMPGAPIARGTEAIRASYQGFFAGNTVKDVKLTDTHEKTSVGLSAGWGAYEMTLAPKAGGAPVVMRGRFTEVAEQQGRSWVYVVDHASDEPPAPGSPK